MAASALSPRQHLRPRSRRASPCLGGPQPAPAPKSLFFNGRSPRSSASTPRRSPATAARPLFAGNAVPEGAEPIAQAYAGHQFGGFSPQLGDGRAVLLGEVIDRAGRRRDIAFKGSGRTPFSRGGDGKAAVGPMLREVLIGEAMHALGIPTTRALAVVATGEPVFRETVLPGAVLTRVAASHIRVGTFQFFAARGDVDARAPARRVHASPATTPTSPARRDRFLALLERVAARQAALIAQWMNVGFIHGVMNTDNMTISGETIDYGPCAFVEAYDPAAVFSSIDQPRPLRLRQPARHRAVEPDAPGRDAAAADRRRRPKRAAERRPPPVIEAFPARYRRAAAARPAGQARPARAGRRRRRGRCGAGERLAGAAACRPRRLHARLAAPRRCRGRRRGAAAGAVRRPGGARRLARALARALRARGRCRAPGSREAASAAAVAGRPAPRACAASIRG